MFIHVNFKNGNKPLLFRGNESMVNEKIEELKKDYYLEVDTLVSGGIFVDADRLDIEEDYTNEK